MAHRAAWECHVQTYPGVFHCQEQVGRLEVGLDTELQPVGGVQLGLSAELLHGLF